MWLDTFKTDMPPSFETTTELSAENNNTYKQYKSVSLIHYFKPEIYCNFSKGHTAIFNVLHCQPALIS